MSAVLTQTQINDLVRARFPGEEARILLALGQQANLLRLQLVERGGTFIGVVPPSGFTATTLDALLAQIAASSSGVTDGDKGDIVVSGGGSTWTIDVGVVGSTKLGGDITNAGKALLTAADAAAQRSALGLGTAATAATTDFAPAAHVGAGGTAHANATTATAGFMSGADKTKLDGVASGATANATDAALRDRATHTGTQAASTISDFNASARAQVEATIIAGASISITPAGTGATRTLTLSATAPNPDLLLQAQGIL